MFTSSKFVKSFYLAIFLLALTLPNETCGAEIDKLPHKKTVARFKFHKIERMDADDDDNDDDGNGDDDGDDEDESDNDENDNNDERDFQFEKVHRSDHSIFRKILEEEQKEVEDEEKKAESDGFKLFSWFWGSDKEKEKKEKSTNRLINWLSSWKGLDKEKVPAPAKARETGENDGWVSYLNRWPFNAFVSFVKSKKIRLPTCSMGRVSDDEPISQEHFDSLLHTMPGFVVNTSLVTDKNCRQQLQIFNHQLRGSKVWPLQMIDASGKIASGMLHGSINQLGDFEMCTQIRTIVKVTSEIPVKMKGKYCLANVEFRASTDALRLPIFMAQGRALWNSHLGNPSNFVPRYSLAHWGICIPHGCNAGVVKSMLDANFGPYNSTGVNFRVDVNDEDCYVKSSQSTRRLIKKNRKIVIALLYFTVYILLAMSNLVVENWEEIKVFSKRVLEKSIELSEKVSKIVFKKEGEEESPAEDKVDGESVVEPEEKVNEVEPEEVEEPEVSEDEKETFEEIDESAAPSLKIVTANVWRSFSMKRSFEKLMSTEESDMSFPIFHILRIVCSFMLYLCIKFVLIGHLPISNRDQLVDFFDNPLSILFRTPMIFLDIQLLISGFLGAYHMSEEMLEKSHIHFLKRMSSKLIRFLPTLYAVIFFQTWILPHMGSGPFWSTLIKQNSQLCELHMWRNMFSVQNAVDFEEACSPVSLQLALELQLFMLAPLIVWLFYSESDAGFYVYGVLHAMSAAARFGWTNTEHLSSTIFHGINVSKFYRTANVMFSSPISRATPYLIGIGAGILYRNTNGFIEMKPSTAKISWITAAFGIIWCFWSPSNGTSLLYVYNSSNAASYASWSPLVLGLSIGLLLFLITKDNTPSWVTSMPILVLSRLTYPIQLITFVTLLYNTAANAKEIRKFSYTDMFNIPEMSAILLLSLTAALLIDIPMKNAGKIIIEKLFWPKPPAIEDEEHEDEVSGEGEDFSEKSEAKPMTPEPTEEIWGSDPEEEEQKYISRRSSIINPPEEEPVDSPVQNNEVEKEEVQKEEDSTKAEGTAEVEEEEEEEE